jgi:hypothetical protein
MAPYNRIIKREFEPTGKRKIIIAKQAGSYFNSPPVFSFRKYDADTPWSNSLDNKPTVNNILKVLKSFEGLQWKDIFQASGGRSHGTNSHFIKVNDLSIDAQKRAKAIDLNELELFSLRLQGDVRFWGVIEPDGRYYVIWYDPNHKVYPVKR